MTATIETGSLCHVAPSSLLLERNIREVHPSKDLTDSIRAVGVLEPVTARLDDDGDLVVRFGHQRVLAAIEVGLDTIPVYVAGRDDTDDDAEVLRIITQRDENTHRRGLTAAEDVGVIAQLAAFGMKASEISKQTRVPRHDVDTALTVAGSKLASGAAARYESMTLEQVATIAEFEDDTDVAKDLILTAVQEPGQFVHKAQRLRDDRDRGRLIAQARTELEAQGVTVLDNHPPHGGKAKALHYLTDTATGTPVVRDNVWRDDRIDEDELWAQADQQIVGELTQTRRAVPSTWYCTDPEANGHKDRYNSNGSTRTPAAEMTETERETARRARALVIENNKAWDSAQTVRRDWIRNLAQAKAAPKGTAVFIATALAYDRNVLTDYRASGVIADLIGAKGPGHLDTHIVKLLTKASDSRAQLIGLVQILGALEATLTQQSWRGNGTNSTAGRYLRFLESASYGLADVEKFAISGKTA